MAAANTDKFQKVGVAGTLTSLSAPGHSVSGTTITVGSTTNWPTDTAVTFAIRQVDSSGVLVAGTYTEWRGVVSGSTLTSMVLVYGTDQVYPAGSTTQVYIPVSAHAHNRMVDALLTEHDQDGTHGAVTASSVTATTGTFTNLTVSGTATSQGWTPLGDVPDTIAANGNRNYDLVFNGVDHTSTLSPGMKLQLTRTVAAPDQCTSLNGTSQYYTKSSPSGMGATDNITVSAWIKMSSYSGTVAIIASRANGTTDGWNFYINGSGQIVLNGARAGDDNVTSYASIPLNKWIHVAASINSAGTTGATYLDGVAIASAYTNNANSGFLTPTGTFTIGASSVPGSYFPGKIAQVAVYSAVLSAATIKNSMDRTLTGSETSLISAYSFDNSINDLNANANNLTAQGSAVATNADSPFANAVTAGLLEYAEVNSVAFSTNTTVNVRVPDTCQIPTSGGISAVSYSTQSNPYGLPYFSRVLAKQLITSQGGFGGTQAIISGSSATVYYPKDSKLRVTLDIPSCSSTAQAGLACAIYPAATVTGTSIASNNLFMTTLSTTNSLKTFAYVDTAGSGSTSFCGSYGVSSGTGSITGNTSFFITFTVELV